MYRDIPMSQRLERIGEILAKGVYLYAKKEKMTVRSELKNKTQIQSKNRIKDKAKVSLDRYGT